MIWSRPKTRRPGGLLRPPVPYWHGASGTVHVQSMNDRHLLNAIRYIERDDPRLKNYQRASRNRLIREVRRRVLLNWPAMPPCSDYTLVEFAELTSMGRSPTGRTLDQWGRRRLW